MLFFLHLRHCALPISFIGSGGLFRSDRMAGKKVGDDGVGDLAEIGVKQADGAEILMVLQANNVVGLVSQFGQC